MSGIRSWQEFLCFKNILFDCLSNVHDILYIIMHLIWSIFYGEAQKRGGGGSPWETLKVRYLYEHQGIIFCIYYMHNNIFLSVGVL